MLLIRKNEHFSNYQRKTKIMLRGVWTILKKELQSLQHS